jgi:hypothetical protein
MTATRFPRRTRGIYLLLNNLFLPPFLLDERRRAFAKNAMTFDLFDMGLERLVGKDPSKSEMCVMSMRIRRGVP